MDLGVDNKNKKKVVKLSQSSTKVTVAKSISPTLFVMKSRDVF